MDFVILQAVAFAASLLTFFSGFGLGTLLMPVFAVWFAVDLAVALTAVVHFLNNLFKLVLIGKHADKRAVVHFGIPAIFSAFLGAWILVRVSDLPPLFTYELFGKNLTVLPIKLIIAILMIVFTLFEILPGLRKLQIDSKYLPLGGLLSGFFGGLSGHQGALRSAFLVRTGLTKESFIATGVVIACLIDVVRMGVYARHFAIDGFSENLGLVAATTLSAFFGAFLGSKLLKKVAMRTVQRIVSFGLFALALALGMGVI